MLVDPALSGLPAFLTPKPGLNSGFMIAAGDRGGAGLGEQAARLSGERRFDPDLGQSGGSRLDGGARRAAAGADGRERRRRSSASSCWPPRRPATSTRRSRPARRWKRCGRACAARFRGSTTTATSIPTSPRRRAWCATARSSTRSAKPSCPAWRGSRDDGRASRLAHRERGEAPLIVSIPHAGVDLAGFEPASSDPWLARKDADWRLDELYDFAEPLGATIVRTTLSRSIIDVNRDPSGASLYPGQATTDLCPTTTFDGEPLYRTGASAGRGGDRRAAAALLRALSRGARAPRSRGCAGRSSASRCSTRIRSARASRGCSTASCRCSISGPIQARAASPGCARRSARRSARAASVGRRRALQGRLDHPRLRQAGRGRRGRADRARLPRLHGRAGATGARQLARADRRSARARDDARTLKRVLETILSEVGALPSH